MHKFYNLTLSQKLIVACCCIVIIALFLMIYSVTRLNVIVTTHEKLLSTTTERQIYLSETKNALTQLRLFTAYSASALDHPDFVYLTGVMTLSFEGQEQIFLAGLAEYREALDNPILRPEERELFQNLLDELIETYTVYHDEVIPAILFAVYTENRQALNTAMLAGAMVGGHMSALLNDVQDAISFVAAKESAYIAALSQRAANTIFLTYAISILLILLFSGFISYIIRSPIKKLSFAVDQVASGDLSYPIRQPYNNEIGKLSTDIADMVDTISKMNKSIAIMDNLDIFMLVIDENRNIIYMNQSMLKAYNFASDSVISLDSEEADERLHWLKDVVNNEQSASNNNNDNSQSFDVFWDSHLEMWFEVREASITWIDNSSVQLYSFIDVTKQKEQETQKAQYERMLEAAVEASQMASLAKSTFIANTSHEIRTPMNSIIGYAELALGFEVMSNKVRSYFDNILSNANLLLQIINDILDISKIEAGKLDMETVPFDIQSVLSNCQSSMQPIAENKNLMLHFYSEANDNKLLLGSPSRLTQVFMNLLSNAIKFTNSGIIKVSSTVVKSTEDTCTFSFSVRDSGIGMSEEQISRIFEPFSQADESISRTYGGSGLGLAITKNLIEAMGGTLAVESVPRVGSKFSFTLTFPTIEMKSSDIGNPINLGDLANPQLRGTVLVCEDNIMNQGVIREHLEKVGLTPVIAANGKIGVELVSQRQISDDPQFDLIFMDINMPVMDGLEAAKLIHEIGGNIPIVAMTANVMVNDLEYYKKSGMADILSKPFTTQELWRCLLKYFVPIHWTEEDVVKVQEGKERIRFKMAERFVKSNSNIYDEIESSLEKGDIEQAHRFAHNLKAHAGMVEQADLYTIASHIEASLTQNINRVTDADMLTLRKELESTMSELMSILDEANAQAKYDEQTAFGISEAMVLFDELKPLIEDGNLKYLSHVDSLRKIPESDELIFHLENIDETNALIALENLRKTLGGE